MENNIKQDKKDNTMSVDNLDDQYFQESNNFPDSSYLNNIGASDSNEFGDYINQNLFENMVSEVQDYYIEDTNFSNDNSTN